MAWLGSIHCCLELPLHSGQVSKSQPPTHPQSSLRIAETSPSFLLFFRAQRGCLCGPKQCCSFNFVSSSLLLLTLCRSRRLHVRSPGVDEKTEYLLARRLATRRVLHVLQTHTTPPVSKMVHVRKIPLFVPRLLTSQGRLSAFESSERLQPMVTRLCRPPD